ncbi:MAG: arginase [Thermoanaerobacteraceae bacterium]|nr:arginase [Thermoanaerobacteraceae bacterium]
MGKNLLSIDWDYFIPVRKQWYFSYIESSKNLNDAWYQRYIKHKMLGEDLERTVAAGPELNGFWSTVSKYFNITKATEVYVSDSHKLSYCIAREIDCSQVFLFDAHADLGYGGIRSLDFEVNCANWLGKLLKDKIIDKATIVYSPYSHEKEDDFKEVNRLFDVSYCKLGDLKQKYDVAVIHICRSGAWTPPWLDRKFFEFVQQLRRPYIMVDCPRRKWNIKNLTFSQQINYLLCS